MLKSTYRAAAPTPNSTDAPLPAGWTEHKAPTGHTYYYNSSTQQSTYTRPAPPSEEPLQIDYGATEPDQVMRASMQVMDDFHRNSAAQPQPGPGHFTGGRSYQEHSRRRGNQGDRPKTKTPILDCASWVLVKTKLGRRFVHNTDTKQSLWKFPQDVMMKVIEMDRLEWEAKKKAEEEPKDQPVKGNTEQLQAEGQPEKAEASTPAPPFAQANGPEDYDSDSYEEVEVTDDEGEGQDGAEPSKRPRLSPSAEDAPPGPVEFNEDDIAWQLAQMEAEGGEDTYSDQEMLAGDQDHAASDEEEGLPLTESDTLALFRSLLDDSTISPYSTFERLIEDIRVVEDPRYLALPTVSARKDAFSAWSKDRIAELQHLKAQESTQSTSKTDPRVTYLRFLHRNATPKLYWPEFKRKFKRAPEMTDRAVSDKDREKMYRELVAKLKGSESERKRELVGLLKDTAKKEKDVFRRRMELEELPASVTKDVRFYTVDEGRRDELVRTFLDTL
ncbi:hypothetical protein H2200_008257 [Cladophialophora chaetospira]|uniref:WW domain-containing protein n=1 Tax=Cladophialophora chaetospira TaxID=386627 RepID=A0AA38X5F3_9EURO|nr:hypothetical protein H2200_008257 [Cladophialophora chaetospira]